jgi:multidrug resistance efflux pump
LPCSSIFSAFARCMTSRIPASDRSAAMPGMRLRERLRRPLLVAFPILLAVVGAADYLAEEPFVSTDDAFVRAAKESINARVAGRAVEIAVQDNQRVRKGQLLFRIDPVPYRIAVDQAEARLASARLQIDGLKATYRQQRRSSNRPRIQRTSTSVSMPARRRSSPGIGPRARSMSEPKPTSRSPASTSHRSNSRSPAPWSR